MNFKDEVYMYLKENKHVDNSECGGRHPSVNTVDYVSQLVKMGVSVIEAKKAIKFLSDNKVSKDEIKELAKKLYANSNELSEAVNNKYAKILGVLLAAGALYGADRQVKKGMDNGFNINNYMNYTTTKGSTAQAPKYVSSNIIQKFGEYIARKNLEKEFINSKYDDRYDIVRDWLEANNPAFKKIEYNEQEKAIKAVIEAANRNYFRR